MANLPKIDGDKNELVSESNKLTEDKITQLIEKELKTKLSFPITYWLPTLVTFAFGVAAIVWAFHGIITPIQLELQDLKKTQQISNPQVDRIVEQIYLEDIIDSDNLSDKNVNFINGGINTLKERNNLVAIIAGYTKNGKNKDQAIYVAKSKELAEKVKAIFLKDGISEDRIFARGYGSKVPDNFPKEKDNNVSIVICDIFGLMKDASK